MLHDHIKIMKWSLTALSYLHCFPIEWNFSAGRVTQVKKRRKLIIAKIVEILQLCNFALMTLIIYKQYTAGRVITLLPNIFMWLVTLTFYLWGMGINLAKNAGALINTIIQFEEWLQNTFHEMNILPGKNSEKSTINRYDGITFAHKAA